MTDSFRKEWKEVNVGLPMCMCVCICIKDSVKEYRGSYKKEVSWNYTHTGNQSTPFCARKENTM